MQGDCGDITRKMPPVFMGFYAKKLDFSPGNTRGQKGISLDKYEFLTVSTSFSTG